MTKLSGIGTKVLLYGAAAVAATVIFAMLCSLLILKEVLPEGQTGLYTGIISGLSVAAACLAGFGKQGQGSLPIAIGVASVYYATVLLAKTVLFPGAAIGLLGRGLTVYLTAIALALLRSGFGKGSRTRKYTARR